MFPFLYNHSELFLNYVKLAARCLVIRTTCFKRKRRKFPLLSRVRALLLSCLTSLYWQWPNCRRPRSLRIRQRQISPASLAKRKIQPPPILEGFLEIRRPTPDLGDFSGILHQTQQLGEVSEPLNILSYVL